MRDKTNHKRTRGRPTLAFSQTTKDRLLRAAAVQFATQNYSDVSMKSIATAAGITDSAIYNHFKSKDDLFLETLISIIEKYTKLYREAASRGSGWKQKMSNIFEVIELDTNGETRLSQIAFTAQYKVVSERDKFVSVLGYLAELRSVFRSIADEAIANKDFPDSLDPEALADSLMVLVTNGVGAAMLGKDKQEDLVMTLNCFKHLLGINSSVQTAG